MIKRIQIERSKSLRDISERLASAKAFECEECEVSPSGYGIRWPLVDEDLSVAGIRSCG